MSVKENKATLMRMYDEVYNKGNLSLAPELVAPDYHFGNLKGPEGWKQAVTTWRTAFPDIHFTVEDAVGEGDWIAYRLSIEGTFKGKWRDIEPTGKKVKGTLAFFSQYENGKLLTSFAFADQLAMYQQMGVTPPAVAETQEANKAVLRRYFEEVLNKGNVSLLDELMDENYVMLRATGEIDNQGREGNKKMFAQTRASVPDIHVLIDDMVAEGDKVVVTGAWEGTQTAALQGVPATGKHFKYGYVATYRVVGGKIASGRIVSDTMTLFQQLGVAPPAFARTAEANKAAIRRTMEEIWNKGDLSKVPELVAADYVGHQALGDVRGQEGFSNMIASARAATPDLHCNIEDLVVEGDKVVCHYTMTGTDTKGIGGAAPTGKQVSVKAMFLTRMKDGKSAETWPISDRLGMYQQLGIAPPTK